MRIGYNTWSMATVPYATFIPALADIGFRSLAISVVPGYPIGGRWVPNAADLAGLGPDDRRRIRDGLRERDLELASVVGNQPMLEQDPARAEPAMQRLRGAVDLCVDLAPPGGPVPTMNTGLAGRSGDLEARRDLALERVGALADYAAARGVVVAIEPHVGGSVDTLERAEWLVQAVNRPSLRLDFDVSHFEVACVPTAESVSRLVPLAAAAEIKDQHVRYVDDGQAAPEGWLVAGNGSGRATAPDGRPLEFQFLLGGEGTFDLAGYLRLMHAQGFTQPIAFEASVQCQARPDYDALAAARRVYAWMADGWRQAGIAED